VKRQRQVRNLAELCVARAAGPGRTAGVGDIRRGMRLLTLVVQWALLSYELGHRAAASEYAERWDVTERQAWRDWATILEFFPGDERELVIDLATEGIRRKRGKVNPAAIAVALTP
jgi:hypothetical protein